jgi:ribokinase
MTAPAFDVIVCGSLHLDIMLYAPALPRLDETVAGTRWEQACGGKGGNQAVMSARAGARTAMIGRVGDDAFGRKLLEHLTQSSVDAREVHVDNRAGSGMSAAIVQNDGDYGAVIVSGSNLHIPAEAIEDQWKALGGARVLALQNEIPEPVNLAAAAHARAFGASVVLNAAPARSMRQELLGLVDVLVVNRVEAEMLTARNVEKREHAIEAARSLQLGSQVVIVTLGADGLVVLSANGQPGWIAPKTIQVVSTHGAGDCFVGTLAARLAAGDAPEQAAAVANAAAAQLVSQERQSTSGQS